MSGSLVIAGGDLYTPERIIPAGVLVIEDGRIRHCGEAPATGALPRLEVPGMIVAPGFVDIHVHGGGGGDFIDGSAAAIRAATRHHARHGTTSLLATTSTAPLPKIFRAFDAITAAMADPGDGAEILGMHMEGPYFAKPEPGCHVVDLIHDPVDADECARVASRVPALARITLAPEIPGALPFIRRLSAAGVVVSGGHSNATYREVRLGREAGMTHLTHHWSAMSGVRRVAATRFAGMIEAGLVCDDLTTEVIADGRHLPTSLLRLAYRCKGPDGLCLVSDAMRASGMPEGIYEVCEMPALVEDGVAVTPDRTSFASSIITLVDAVRHMVKTVGIALPDALRMASRTPATVIGRRQRKGALLPGLDGDVVVLDPRELTVQAVVIGGRLVEGARTRTDTD